MTEFKYEELTEAEKEQFENIDFTPLDDLYEPVPQWKHDVDRISELLTEA